MIVRIDVERREGVRDSRGESLRRQAAALGIQGIRSVRVADLYFLEGELQETELDRILLELLHDPVVERASWRLLEEAAEDEPAPCETEAAGGAVVEVTLLPGVTDSVAESLLAAARLAGVQSLQRAATGKRYELEGDLKDAQIQRIARGLLANEVVQRSAVNQRISPPFKPPQDPDPTVEEVPLTAAGDEELEAVSARRRLSLNLQEMQALRDYYRGEGREPTDVELEMLAQTWSEHCVHKTFRARITYHEQDVDGAVVPASRTVVDGLLKTHIRGATEKAGKTWIRSAFVDNAGIVAFDDRYDLAFKVETHNHPSALEPFGGANTGVGGVVRDVLGVSARPIANTDVLCFGPPDESFHELPAGVLHPRRIADGVVDGIEDYGNKMGIPTVNGAVLYDPGYTANPLVYCGCLGLLPRGSHPRHPRAGDLVVVFGGRTGRDGLRGATFSSMEMDHETGEIAGSAVQIGHPIHEKQALEVCLAARDEGLYTAVTDCGAGGLSSAVGEMGAELGAEVQLQDVPLKYPGLRPWEIWLSEAQERMVVAVPPENWARLQEICRRHDVEVTRLGLFTDTGRLVLRYGDRVVADLDMDFLHDGLPRREMEAWWKPPRLEDPARPEPADLTESLLRLLAAPDTRSKEDVVRVYDHEVQGGTVVKPLVGPAGIGPGDAAVLAPLDAWSRDAALRGVALSVGVNPQYGKLDPYAMAWAAVDEAIRNVVAVGADPDRIALLDNFCWGNPNLPDRLGGLVRCSRGCHDAAVAHGAPFVSGKDSLNNEYTGADGRKHAIPGTILISALGIVPSVDRTVTMDLKQPGDRIYLIGLTRNELGGSAYRRLQGSLGMRPPGPAQEAPRAYRALHRCIREGWVRACHDLSEGGLAVAAAEMALAGECGIQLELSRVPRAREEECGRSDVLAFSESLGRLLVEVPEEHTANFEDRMTGTSCAPIGQTLRQESIRLLGISGDPVVETDLQAVTAAWRGHLTHRR